MLSTGSYGIVVQALDVKEGKLVALKFIKRAQVRVESGGMLYLLPVVECLETWQEEVLHWAWAEAVASEGRSCCCLAWPSHGWVLSQAVRRAQVAADDWAEMEVLGRLRLDHPHLLKLHEVCGAQATLPHSANVRDEST